ncbi:uncharacterized protein ASPGLDRAFT_36188 [Aspergillus glaucus CBS 516.65]|uniref:Uncharacterized protein n=1 Tax=Aspergillus glaucus CBS 516.65 TaxID=1160497 RepID=A0A1L9VHR8_ASPGL|nr:hypothetical protein ASPGLDRAFT_36188 [Aspergillus glaucus CBS 516.65]OJJ83422.1 hypothetical protein ASPGLDRAFT_36188 [Aspergillus glaucus CBS 516.65]
MPTYLIRIAVAMTSTHLIAYRQIPACVNLPNTTVDLWPALQSFESAETIANEPLVGNKAGIDLFRAKEENERMILELRDEVNHLKQALTTSNATDGHQLASQKAFTAEVLQDLAEQSRTSLDYERRFHAYDDKVSQLLENNQFLQFVSTRPTDPRSFPLHISPRSGDPVMDAMSVLGGVGFDAEAYDSLYAVPPHKAIELHARGYHHVLATIKHFCSLEANGHAPQPLREDFYGWTKKVTNLSSPPFPTLELNAAITRAEKGSGRRWSIA